MAVYRVDEILAKTDPFDLAQAIERHVAAMGAKEIRTLVAQARERAGSAYSEELGALLDPGLSDAELRIAFMRFLRGNLRTVAYFGPSFSQRVLSECPRERVTGFGEEHRSRSRALVIAATALALLLIGAAAQHAVVIARARAQVPEPHPPVVAYVPVQPRRQAEPPIVHPRQAVAPIPRAIRTPQVASATVPAAQPAPVQAMQPAPVGVAVPKRIPARRRPLETRGAVVNVRVTPAPPAPQPSPIDVDGMPDATAQATPLPQQSAEPASVGGHGVAIPSPTPVPNHRSWFHRAIMHLDPFKAPGSH